MFDRRANCLVAGCCNNRLIPGEFSLPQSLTNTLRSYSNVLVLAGAAIMLIPLVNHRFWLNQGMWLAPALLFFSAAPEQLAPVTPRAQRPGRLALNIGVAGVAAGLVWEALNWLSRTHWEYLILTSWPHLFQMPWLGYIGFIPFAFTALVVYVLSRRIPANARAGLFSYAIAFGGLYVLSAILYDRRGIWVGYDFLSSGVR